MVYAGIWNSGSAPRNRRITTAAPTAASTTAPRIPALHVPITSSITKSTAEIGALKAAASPAAAPTGAIKRTFSRERCSRRPSADAIPAPICSEGSSGPSDWPLPMASAHIRNFPITVSKGIYPS